MFLSPWFSGLPIAWDWHYVRYPKHAFETFIFLKYCHLWWNSMGWNHAVFQKFWKPTTGSWKHCCSWVKCNGSCLTFALAVDVIRYFSVFVRGKYTVPLLLNSEKKYLVNCAPLSESWATDLSSCTSISPYWFCWSLWICCNNG